MQKEHVYVVTGRNVENGSPVGGVVTLVVCAESEKRLKKFIAETLPSFAPTTITSLVMLEERAKKIRNALGGRVPDWPVLIDPTLMAAA